MNKTIKHLDNGDFEVVNDMTKAELAELDLKVAKALGKTMVEIREDGRCWTWNKFSELNGSDGKEVLSELFEPSTNWAQGGPIIEECGICLNYNTNTKKWNAGIPGHATKVGHPEIEIWEHCVYMCETPLIAACRAFVASQEAK